MHRFRLMDLYVVLVSVALGCVIQLVAVIRAVGQH